MVSSKSVASAQKILGEENTGKMAKQATPMIVILQRCFVHGAGKLGTRPSVDTVNGIMVDLICGAFARLAVRAMILAKVESGT